MRRINHRAARDSAAWRHHVRATLTASPACADKLPEAARERTYDVTVYANGNLKWEGATLHAIIVTGGTLSDSPFTFSLGDSNHVNAEESENIRDPLESGGTLIIWGKGAGAVQDTLSTGTLDGAFTFLTGTGPEAEACEAADHRFTFVRE